MLIIATILYTKWDILGKIFNPARCLKITEKVSFNIASEASYIYILSGQKFIKKVKNGQFWKTEACGQTVLPNRSILIGQKLMENAKIEKFKCDILGDFQTLCSSLQTATWMKKANII